MIKLSTTFRPLYFPTKRYILNIGPRLTGKSWNAANALTIRTEQDQMRRSVLCRDQNKDIEQTILAQVKSRFEETGIIDRFEFNSEKVINKKNKREQIICKGFHTSSNAQVASLKSLVNIDEAMIEEGEEVEEDDFLTLDDSIRNHGSFIVMNMNVPHRNHWVIRRFFNLEDSEYAGWFKAKPKSNMEDVEVIWSTLNDNFYAQEANIKKLKAYGDESSPFYNIDKYCKDFLGLVSDTKKGKVYKGWQTITDEEYDQLPFHQDNALDFGFAQDPCGVVSLKFHNRTLWVKERLYEKGLVNKDLADRLKEMNIKDIICDSAEPKSIKELQNEGINATAAEKGPDSIRNGIQFIQGLNVYYTESSKNLMNEYFEYSYKERSDGTFNPNPEDRFNHLMDPMRYGVEKYSSTMDYSDMLY